MTGWFAYERTPGTQYVEPVVVLGFDGRPLALEEVVRVGGGQRHLEGVTLPTDAVAALPVVATDVAGATVPTAPVPPTPEIASVTATPRVPTAAVPDTPVNATVTSAIATAGCRSSPLNGPRSCGKLIDRAPA